LTRIVASSHAKELIDPLSAGLEEILGEKPEDFELGRLIGYLDLLCQWNETYNLTAVRRPEDMISRHLLDSLSVLPWIGTGPLLDAGSGAGLPGVPLAITRPGSPVTLLDSAGKKIRFLQHVRRQLTLENIFPVQDRLESWIPDSDYDVIITRALSDLAGFVRAARHLAGENTRLMAMKGKYPESELNGLPGWVRVRSVEKLEVPGLQEQRHLVIMSVTDSNRQNLE
jgi:16S rRNA (guanine527-N7)-methyltransferase